MKKKKRLGVNIDHVATIRNARGEYYPEPLQAALLAQKSGADSITIHLREDRRHINDVDLKSIKKKIKIPLNLEIAPTNKMIKIALNNKPNFVCIVPEKRKEITTEGGLNLNRDKKNLKKYITMLKMKNIKVSLFVNPNLNDIKIAASLNCDCVELHTGSFCNAVLNNNKKIIKSEYNKLELCSKLSKKLSLEVHAGHGLTYKSADKLRKINEISEFNIGHFIVAESIFVGMDFAVKKFIKIINN